MTPLELGIVVALLGVAIAAIVSGFYILYIYRQRHEEALFLSRLVARDVRVAMASAVIVVYIVLALLGATPGRPWGSLIIGGAIVVLMWGVVSDALLWRKERRK